jgi:hypothetical protein
MEQTSLFDNGPRSSFVTRESEVNMALRVRTRVQSRRSSAFHRVWVLALIVTAPSLARAVGYQCNVHDDRTIYPSYSGGLPAGTPHTTSLRDECFAASGSAPAQWPICQCINGTTNGSALIVSDLDPNHYTDPLNPTCPPGYLELGRCIAAEKYYVAEGSAVTPNTTNVHRSFVPNPDVCEPCGHDVVSTVLGCKALCRRYFTGRFYERSDESQHDNGGSWRILHPDGLNNPDDVPTLDDFYICDVNDPTDPVNDPINPQPCPATQAERQASGRPTAMEVCERRCGPPNKNNPPNAPVWNQPGDNWWYVTYTRRDPNQILDTWIRSYNNVPDRPDPPAKECETMVAEYCEYLDVLLAPTGGLTSGQKYQCKKNLLIRSPQILGETGLPPDEPFVDYHGKTFDFTDTPGTDPFKATQFGMNNDGFCDHLRRGNNACSQTCAQVGDGFSHQFHNCQTAGILQPNSDCIGPALNLVSGRLRGGAVCALPPPVDNDFSGFNRGARFNKVTVVTPPKEPGCTGTRTAMQSATLHYVVYESPYAVPPETPSGVALGEMARATWRNLKNGAWGGINFFGPYGLWVTDAPVPLVSGQRNTIVYTFTDRQLRTSGDAIELIGP